MWHEFRYTNLIISKKTSGSSSTVTSYGRSGPGDGSPWLSEESSTALSKRSGALSASILAARLSSPSPRGREVGEAGPETSASQPPESALEWPEE